MTEKLEINGASVEFAKRYFALRGQSCEITEEDGACFVHFSEDKDGFITALLLNFYKLREVLREFPNKTADDLPFCAFIGAILSLDKNDDEQKIKKQLEQLHVVNMDGFYDFQLDELRENWQDLAKLSKKLFSQCRTKEDICALTTFMLGINIGAGRPVAVASDGHIHDEKSGDRLDVYPYWNIAEMDLITSILSHNPSDIYVQDADCVSGKFLQTIKTLGE